MSNNSFFDKYRHIHFVGVGGISMSALAKLSISKGVFVSGSDITQSEITDELKFLGAEISIGHKKKNVSNADLLVYTCAVGKKNVEVLEADKMGIPVMERADFLAEITKQYKKVIAVAGSHGKTTVCSQIGEIFKKSGLNPTILVGGESDNSSNLTLGGNDFLIVEACEYQEHFLKLKHDVSVILNVDYDHPDYFKSASEYSNAFFKFAMLSTQTNVISEKYKILLCNNDCVTYGIGGTYYAKRIKYFADKIMFDVYKNGKFFLSVTVNMTGEYNMQNTLASIAVCDVCKIDRNIIKNCLQEYKGVRRRFEYVGKINNAIVITDYAHHPTQIANCIKSTKLLGNGKITIVFEPHTYTRTKKLFSNFVSALGMADKIILLPTYSAREKPLKGGTSKDLYNAMVFKTDNIEYINSYVKCYKRLLEIQDGVILIVGAGSINKLAKKIKVNYLNKNQII